VTRNYTIHPSHPHTPGLGGRLNGLIDAMIYRLDHPDSDRRKGAKGGGHHAP
jgi:hypothetical protein